jgi:hypothetical protein
MIGKKINQLATELAPATTDLTIIGDPVTGVSKKITLAQLGAIFSGAVSFYTNLAAFPVTGDINVIYCAKDTQKLYLWSGSAYVEVFPSQALLDTYQLRSEKGNANGYASLDSGGKVPISQLPSSIMEYKGTWNAATNTPTLANGTGDTGDVYICNVAGTVNFGAGPLTFAVGDYVIYSGTIWQRSSGAVGTVTSVAASITGDSLTISGSPVTTSGTLAFAFNGTTAQYIRGNGTLETFPSLTGFVPYTGATANVDLGNYDLTTDIVNLNQLKAVGSGGLNIYSNSGTHIALMGGGGGAGTTFYGGIIGVSASFTSSGSSDTFGITHSSGSGIALNITKGGNGEGLYINKTSGSGNAATIIGTLNATSLVKSGGTSAQFLKADGSVDSTSYGTGSVTSVGLSSATSGVTIGSTPITTSGTITLAIATASGSQQGLLSSTDWTTFNNKQNALTNPVTGTGTTNYLPKFTGASTIGNSILQEGTNAIGLGITPSAWSLLTALQVKNASLSGFGNNAYVFANGYYDGSTSRYISNGFASYIEQSDGRHIWYTAPSGTAGNAISFTQAMTLDASGRLGIGTTSPQSKLDVITSGYSYAASPLKGTGMNLVGAAGTGVGGGDGTASGVLNIIDSAAMGINNGGTVTLGGNYISSGNAYALTYAGIKGGKENGTDYNSAGYLALYTTPSGASPAERLRITSAGNVGIGTTNPTTYSLSGTHTEIFGGSTYSFLHVNTTTVKSFLASNESALLTALFTFSNHPLTFGTNNTERMRITSGGNVEINTGSIKTGEPDTGWGRAAIKIGARVSGTATGAGGYLPVSVDGTVYYINLNSSTP